MMLGERHKERLKREDRRAGEVVATFININRDHKKDPHGIDWTDVFPEWKEEAEQTEEDMYQTMLMFSERKQLPS